MKKLIPFLFCALVVLLGCSTRPEPRDPSSPEWRMVAGQQLETAASVLDRVATSEHDKDLATSMRIVASWLKGGFTGTRAELEQAVTIVRMALAEARRRGKALPEEVVSCLGLDVTEGP